MVALCVVLSRKVDCDVGQRAAKLKIIVKLAVVPSSLRTLLKNAPALSETSWNKQDEPHKTSTSRLVLVVLVGTRFKSRSVLFRPVCTNFKNAFFLKEKSRKTANGTIGKPRTQGIRRRNPELDQRQWS